MSPVIAPLDPNVVMFKFFRKTSRVREQKELKTPQERRTAKNDPRPISSCTAEELADFLVC